MASAKKKGGLGAESYFENIPTLEPVEKQEPREQGEATEQPAEIEAVTSEATEVIAEPKEEPAHVQEEVADGTVESAPAEEEATTAAQTTEEAPSAEEEVPASDQEAEKADAPPDEPPPRQKIRRTYALYEETQIALEEMKLAARKRGVKTTLGDLMEEAVQLLMEKKGMTPEKTDH